MPQLFCIFYYCIVLYCIYMCSLCWTIYWLCAYTSFNFRCHHQKINKCGFSGRAFFSKIMRQFTFRTWCTNIFYTFTSPLILRDLLVSYNVTDNAKISATTNTTYRLSCILVTINAWYITSNIASFTADCKTTELMYHLVSNIQHGGRKPEVQITFHSYSSIDVVPKPNKHYQHCRIHVTSSNNGRHRLPPNIKMTDRNRK